MNLYKYERLVFSLAIGGLLLLGLFTLLHGTSQIAHADPGLLFVKPDGAGTDCTQVQPCALQAGLSQATAGDTIYVATGVYTGSGAAVITVTQSITLYGGWDGTTTTPVVRDPALYPSTLDGENGRRGVHISGDITPTLDGFIITGGDASNVAANPGCGGGIYSTDADPIITNNVITNSIAYTSTTTYGRGGGIYLYNASASALVSGNIIASNVANTLDRGRGGGIHMVGSAATISNNTFRGNVAGTTANSKGGGLYLGSSSAIVSDNLIQNNKASSTGAGFGGGFYTQFGAVTLNGNTIISNVSSYGALTFNSNTYITMTNNVVAQNVGGVFVRGNATYPLAGTLMHNTIAQNGDDEGVYVGYYDSGYSTLILTNNIIVSHTTGIYVHQDTNNSNVVTATHTLFYGNSVDTSGSHITSTNEITGRGPLFVDPAGWDYHLQVGSPAVDAGVAVPWLTTDIDGDLRPNGLYDIGADEFYCYALTGVDIAGAVTGIVDTAYTFTATVAPPTANLPITYTWSPQPDAGQGSAIVTYTWTLTGAKAITVTAENCGGPPGVSNTHTIAIAAPPWWYVYLPLVLRGYP